ncbi:MAG: 1-acyl-sn-glycerol-3-phosphate acyltransferase [Bacteroidales bacterium]|jgi:putative hemolysin|nr:1-acyl-sn-glycerol-3-phosphate acyltransferase [Bacteroidales bacterium]OQC60834.1 MAG: hypothetical protein BWX51_00789 [Bacteroidetes bacterium ADurb.Bin012]MBP9511143.1 1-acyl-sn-glycerol-3-phosphate acyltransferase [Bacteroidales bacterium]MBP9588359.1 1-acyl-sn-glycerol-3-phosphate acyltransferase [Bacteroidales bacterium]HNQ59742.1 1-acyl-sn-glycerol-3-phosphate acyltransferase [Bacteroidales bacterium]
MENQAEDISLNAIQPKKIVDLDEVIRQKSARVYRMLPRFVVHWLEKIIHQDGLNYILTKYEDQEGLEFIESVLNEFGLRVDSDGAMGWDPKGRYIFVANHPLGGMDGMAFMMVVGRYFPEVVFPVNDFLLYLPNIRNLFIPINKHGRNPELIKLLDDTFASDKTILYFPAGLCSRSQHGEILDLEWKKTFVTKARLHQRDIVPVHITGRNSAFFYRLANLRKSLHIHFNFEMILLVDEMFKQKGKSLLMRFGPVIPYTQLDRRFSDYEWANLIRAYIYRLGKGDLNPFQPI